MGLDVFENYECDGQIEISNLKGERMDKLIYIPADQIHEHPDNPRKDLGDLTELAESIRQNGIMQNLTVIPGYWDNKRGFHEEEYTLLIGHRRYSAGKMAAVTEYPCRIITGMSYKEQVGTMLTENMQRVDLTIPEQAEGFQMMLDLGDTVEDIANKTGFSESTVRHRVNIAKLDKSTLKEKNDDEGFQLTLKDLYELEKIKSVEKRNEILRASYSSTDLATRARSAVADEKRKAKETAIIEKLEAAGIKKAPKEAENGIWTGSWKTVAECDLNKDDDIDILDTEGKYWITQYQRIRIVEKVIKKQTRAEERREKEEKERKARTKELKEIIRVSTERRKQLILDIIAGKAAKPNEELVKNMCWVLLVEMGGVYKSLFIKFFTEKNDWECNDEEKAEANEKIQKLSIMEQMLILLHMRMRGEEPWDYNLRYDKEDGGILLECYRVFKMFGWFFDTEQEEQVLDGTHEYYRKDEDND